MSRSLLNSPLPPTTPSPCTTEVAGSSWKARSPNGTWKAVPSATTLSAISPGSPIEFERILWPIDVLPLDENESAVNWIALTPSRRSVLVAGAPWA